MIETTEPKIYRLMPDGSKVRIEMSLEEDLAQMLRRADGRLSRSDPERLAEIRQYEKDW
jgi:predicted DNA-binding antitoxin AbrB/MazE fold protein